jgi:hypothetical protein
LKQITDALAATRALHSGEAGYQLGREQQNYTRATYDANQSLLDYLSQLQQSFVQGERQRQQQAAGGLDAVIARLLALFPNGVGGGGGGTVPTQSAPPVADYHGEAGPGVGGTGAGYGAPSANIGGVPNWGPGATGPGVSVAGLTRRNVF